MPIVPVGALRPMGAVIMIGAGLLGAGGASVYYHNRDGQLAKTRADEQAQTLAALNDARGQILALSTRLDALAAASKPSPVETPSPAVAPRRRIAATRARAARVEDPRFQQIESKLSDQQKELSQTREEVAQAREDLQGKLDSTRDELGTSIAKNHDELVALQKRGERNYHEFTLSKSKDFQTVGPFSLSLRKADTKHKTYNLAMVVSDSRLEKKRVNLYEPIMISLSDRPQPVELVVNQIGKDEVQGYVSEPRYKKSELAENTPAPPKPQQLITR